MTDIEIYTSALVIKELSTPKLSFDSCYEHHVKLLLSNVTSILGIVATLPVRYKSFVSRQSPLNSILLRRWL